MKQKKSLLNLSLYSFLISLFLIKIPPFYILPFLNKFFSSHTAAKIILIANLSLLFLIRSTKIMRATKQGKIVLSGILLFLLSQSVSIFAANDVLLFWKSYHNIVLGTIIFIESYLLVRFDDQIDTKINLFILITGIFVVFFSALFFFLPFQTLLPIFKTIVQKEVLDAYQTDLLRGRYSLSLNIEIFLPFFLFNYLIKKRKLFLLLSLGTIFLSLVSNFRSQVVMALFGSLISFFLLKKYISRGQKLIVLFLFTVVITIAIFASNLFFNFNFIDRFLQSDELANSSGDSYRLNSVNRSMDLFLSSPLIGVGLGNYINFNRDNETYRYSLTIKSFQKSYSDLVRLSPHNIFLQLISETGVLGLLTFLFILYFFIFSDFKIIQAKKMNNLYPYILSSWTLFIYTLFNPAYSIFIIGWFWFLRGVIEGRLENSSTTSVQQ